MRKVLTYAATIGAVFALATGCGSDDRGTPAPGVPSAPPGVPTTAAEPAAPTPAAPTPAAPTPAAPGTAAPGTAAPPARPQRIRIGAHGAAVLALQQRLTQLGYWNGTPDASFGGTTQQAVFALQKAAGLSRDGVVGPRTQEALDQGVRPRARATPGTGTLVEIDLARQLLMFVTDGQVVATLNTSTGSNQHYVYEGETYLADTPPGHFRVGRQIDGWRHGPLGPLWRPKYFNGGIAVHGAPSVPPYPASHGCARVSIAAMNWIWSTNKLPLKTRIWVYGG